jgi:hypothetical protein
VAMRSTLAAVAMMAVVLSAPGRAGGQECPDDGPTWVAVTASLGVAAGATGALVVAGALTAEPKRDFDFLVGAFAGIGVTAGLSTIYGLYDGLTGCRMASDQIAWSIPIAMFIVGSLIPLGVWAGSDEIATEASAPAPLVTLRF